LRFVARRAATQPRQLEPHTYVHASI
jgi:hypothetical protein